MSGIKAENTRAVSNLLRETSKGQLSYDRTWLQDGRAKSILDDVARNLTCLWIVPSVSVDPKVEDAPRCCNQTPMPCSTSNLPESYPETQEGGQQELHKLCKAFQKLSETEVLIRNYEEERIKTVQDKVEAKKALLEQHSQQVSLQTEQAMHFIQDKLHLEWQKMVKMIKTDDQRDRELREKYLQRREHRRIQDKLLSAKMRDAELKQKILEEEQQARAREQELWKQTLSECHLQLLGIMERTTTVLYSCHFRHLLPSTSDNHLQELASIRDSVQKLAEKGRNESVADEDVLTATSLTARAHHIFQSMLMDVEKANLKGQQESAVSSSRVEVLPVEETKDTAVHSSEKGGPDQKKTEKLKADNALYQYVDPKALEEYVSIMEKHAKWKESYQQLLDNKELKRYRFDLQRAINTPINAISDLSGDHVYDKLNKLRALLLGQTVEVGGKFITTRQDPMASKYCFDLVARKLVMQAEEQVASKHQASFVLAAVIVSLWSEFPDLGDLFLAHFYVKCPYLVPYYIPRQENQSQEEYYRALGYTYDGNGTVEKQDMFLKRMSGIIRLYAAVVQSQLPPRVQGHNPRGLLYGWHWLARVLNLEPRPDITATMLLDFLEVSGFALSQAYGQQFQKLLHALCKDYFPSIKKVTSSGSGGPMSRLEDFLHGVVRKNRIPQPEGMLRQGFWYTS